MTGQLALLELPAARPMHIGQCGGRGCSHVTRSDSTVARCPTHGLYRLARIDGAVTDHKCDASCRYARGPRCDCSCGGANHGAGYAHI